MKQNQKLSIALKDTSPGKRTAREVAAMCAEVYIVISKHGFDVLSFNCDYFIIRPGTIRNVSLEGKFEFKEKNLVDKNKEKIASTLEVGSGVRAD